MCKDNFSGDGSFFVVVEGGCLVEFVLFFRVSSMVDFFSMISSLGDCFSIEYRFVNGGDLGGEVVDEEEIEESEIEEDLFLLLVRRMRSNSFFVNLFCLLIDFVVGFSKELESIVSGVIEILIRKRIREKM